MIELFSEDRCCTKRLRILWIVFAKTTREKSENFKPKKRKVRPGIITNGEMIIVFLSLCWDLDFFLYNEQMNTKKHHGDFNLK